jgi:hypothetical protein
VGFDGAIPFVTSLGVRSLAEGVAYRVLKAYPAVIIDGTFERAGQLLYSDAILGDMEPVEPWDTWRWLMSITNGRRRKILVRAWKMLTDRGQRHKMFEMISPFVKTENLPWFKIIDGMPVPEAAQYVCRLIQAPHDETHVLAGRFLKPLTNALKAHWHYRNWIFYASTSPEKLDAWLTANAHAQSYFWSDYSAFDATWSEQAWHMVETFYRHILTETTADFWDVLDVWRCPRGRVKLRKEEETVWYESEAANASGRDDTALANALLNGIALSLSFSAAIAGKPVEDLLDRDVRRASELLQIAVVGDDSLVCCSFDVRPYAQAVQRNLEGFGLVVKAECSADLWDVTFLGSMPYLTRKGYFWGPTLGRRLYKAFWQADPVGHLPAWTKGVAQQMALHRHVPILSEIAERVLKLLERQAVTVQFDENKPYQSRTMPTPKWDDRTVEWMCRRYQHLSPSMFTQDLWVIRSIERLPCVMHSAVFNVCVAQDDL